MRYVVEAGFCNGKPRLRVVDADSGEVRVEWFLEPSRDPVRKDTAAFPQTRPAEQHNGMQSLLKNLFLIACSDDLDRSRDNDQSGSGKEQNHPSGEIFNNKMYGVSQ